MGMTAFPRHLMAEERELNDHVPGFAVNGWLVRHPLERWGEAWIQHGSMEVRYRRPLHVGDRLVVTTSADTDRIELSIAEESGTVVASGWAKAPDPERPIVEVPAEPRPDPLLLPYADTLLGRSLGTLATDFDAARDLAWVRLLPSDDPWQGRTDAHPAVLVWSANVLVRRAIAFTLGQWKHAGTVTEHYSSIPDGAALRYCGRVARTFRAGAHEFFVAEVLVEADGAPTDRLELTYLCEQRTPDWQRG
jgi:hypothetical protein